MNEEKLKGLRAYLQTVLNLSSALPDPDEGYEFYEGLSTRLQPHHGTLRDAINKAVSDKKDLRTLIEQDLEDDFTKIPDGTNHADTIDNIIKRMDSIGCILEFIAAAHKYSSHSPKLNAFVRKALRGILKDLMPASPQPPLLSEMVSPTPSPQPVPLSQVMSPTPPAYQAGGLDGEVRSRNTGKSNGKATRKNRTGGTAQSASPGVGQNLARAPIPFPQPPAPENKQPAKDPITLAHERISKAKEKLQIVHKVLEKGETLSQRWIIDAIKEAKAAINGISAIFDNIPTPNYHNLRYGLAGEEKYICEEISFIQGYALQEKHADPSPFNFQQADERFSKIFSELRKLETDVSNFEQQIGISNQVKQQPQASSS